MPPEPAVLPALYQRTQSWQWYVEWQTPHSAHYHGVEKQLFSGESPFQKIEIYQTHLFGKLLVLDGDPQSSEHDEDIYHEVLVHPSLALYSSPKRVLILGGGEGATLREVLRHRTIEKAVMVDIDQLVVDICKKELPHYSNGGYDDPRVELRIEDAKKYLQETSEVFDCVISDLTEPYPETPTQGLLNEHFFSLIKSKMKPNGILAMQASHAVRGKNELYMHYVKMLKKLWKIVRPYRAFIPSFYSEWGFVLASDIHDALKIPPQEIDNRLKDFSSHLNYYDGTIHASIFTPTKEVRAQL